MAQAYGDDDTVAQILGEQTRTWAVVGLSNDTSRAAWGVAKFLQEQGKRIVPVHPRAETVHGQQGYRTLAEIPFGVDVVDVFVRSSAAGAVADDAVRIGAKAVWFQLGVVDEAAYDRTRAVGVAMVMDRCPKIDWPTLGPAPLG
jgi:predicted CoA-binding protein